MFNVNTKSPEKEKKAEKEEVKKFKLNAIDNEYANAKCQDKENEKEKEKVKDNNNTKKKRAKKRKATMPVGGPSKKVKESTQNSETNDDNSDYCNNSDEEMNSEKEMGNNDSQWESELNLKDSRWSISKARRRKVVANTAVLVTPIVIKHNNSTKSDKTTKLIRRVKIPVLSLPNENDPDWDSDVLEENHNENPENNQASNFGTPMQCGNDVNDENEENNENDENASINILRDTISVSCLRLNKSAFRGTINYTEAKNKIFEKGLGLQPNLLCSVKMTFKDYPTVHFKLNNKINIAKLKSRQLFNIERIYHSGGTLVTDIIKCKVLGIPRSEPLPKPLQSTRSQTNNEHQWGVPINPNNSNKEAQTVRINGISSNYDVKKVKNWLEMYGELIEEITEESHYDPDPEANKVGNGIYTVKMKIKKEIPNFLPASGLKIRIYYKGCILLCPNCYRVHPKRYCTSAKLPWIGYVQRFILNNPNLDAAAYGRWWHIIEKEYPNFRPNIQTKTYRNEKRLDNVHQNPDTRDHEQKSTRINESETTKLSRENENEINKEQKHRHPYLQATTKRKENSQDTISTKLREIRNQMNQANTTTKLNKREAIEKSIEKHMKEGLSVDEAIEYEENQNRARQLEAKMGKTYVKTGRENQYKGQQSYRHD